MWKFSFVFATFVLSVSGLQCWNCQNAGSSDDCDEIGFFQTCSSEEDMCSTTVRKENGLTRIFKECKQRLACINNAEQNSKPDRGGTQCNEGSPHSLCTCCCDGDGCNSGDVTCARDGSTTAPRDQTRCPAMTNLPHGEIECSNGNDTGSVCEFKCTESDYKVHPERDDLLQCLPTGSWDKEEPCCALPCPPYVLFDVLAMVHASDNETYAQMGLIGALAFRDLVVSVENGNMYAKLEFSGNVHEEGLLTYADVINGNFNPGDSRRPRFNTPDGQTNIGEAFTWAWDNMRSLESGNRPRVRDVIILSTDTSSNDDITGPAKLWRDQGTLIYAMLFPDAEGDFPDYEQMLEITEDEDHIYRIEDNLEEAKSKLLFDVLNHLCESICTHPLHDHE